MTRRWTPEQEAWLREVYPTEHMPWMVGEFERRFGRRVSASAMSNKAGKLGLHKELRDIPDRAVRTVRWCDEPEMQAWMEANDTGQSLQALSAQFASEFGFPLARTQINLWRASNGRSARHRRGGRLPKPVGSETIRKGYVYVKVRERAEVPMSKDDWRRKHVVVWERDHGPLPDDMNVLFADHDNRNFSPGNLVAVPSWLMARLNSPSSPEWHDAETLRAAVAWCELSCGIASAEARVPRACGVCGRPFVPQRPDANQSVVWRNAKTCPECLARGRKTRGERSVKFVGTCRVCGRRYEATQKNQTRCPECIAAKPRHGWRQQAHK